jgi:hypothetical protein
MYVCCCDAAAIYGKRRLLKAVFIDRSPGVATYIIVCPPKVGRLRVAVELHTVCRWDVGSCGNCSDHVNSADFFNVDHIRASVQIFRLKVMLENHLKEVRGPVFNANVVTVESARARYEKFL